MRAILAVTVNLWIAYTLAAQATQVSTTAAATADDTFQLTSSAKTATRTFLVDRTGSLNVSIAAPSRTLSVVLAAPSGAQFAVGSASTAVFQSAVVPVADGNTLGAGYFVSIANPELGSWKLTVTETAPLTTPVDVVVTYVFNNPTVIVLVGGGDSFPASGQLRLALVVFDNTVKLKSLTVQGRLRKAADPASSAAAFAFRDDGTAGDRIAGDGIYEIVLSIDSPGEYVVHAAATGLASTGQFRRTAATRFRIVARIAKITGFFDRGIDENSDGYFDQIAISPSASVTKAGTYQILARLRGSNGNEILATKEATLPAGEVFEEVFFPADRINSEVGVDGPYSVAEIRLSELAGNDLVPAGISYDLGQTRAYDLDGLQHPTVRLDGTGSSRGIDLDGNQRFDTLEITLGVLVDFAGEYAVSVSLSDSAGREIGFASGAVTLDQGRNTLIISFAGFPIGANGVNGPYALTNLIMFGEQQSLVVTTAFVTPFFRASQFEGFEAPASPSKRRSTRH